MKKLVIMDTVCESILIFDIDSDKTNPENLLELLFEMDIISNTSNIHWQVMENLTIKNYTK